MLVNMTIPCQDKQVMLMAEEVMAGRMEVLESLPLDQLQKVLDEVTRKRKCDHNYIRESKKKRLLRQPPQVPDIRGSKVFVSDQSILASNEFMNSFVSAGLQASCPKAGLRNHLNSFLVSFHWQI